MPRQLQLTQNLLDRAATAWNVVYSTVSFLINFPSHFEAFVKWIDSLDPSQALASSKIGAYLLNSAARQADGAWRAAKGRALQRKGHTNPVDEGPSDHWVEVHADSHHLREGRVGFVSVEVLQAGGWTRANMGDAFSRADEHPRRVAPARRTGPRGVIGLFNLGRPRSNQVVPRRRLGRVARRGYPSRTSSPLSHTYRCCLS